MEHRQVYIVRPLKVRLGVRVGPTFTLSFLALLLIPLVVFACAYSLPERPPYSWVYSAEGTLGLAMLCLTLVGGVFLGCWWLFPAGEVALDPRGMRWQIAGERGRIAWHLPFQVKRWQARYEVSTTTYEGQAVLLPVVVCEISQGENRLAFWYAGRGQGLSSGPLLGLPLVFGVRRLVQTLERLERAARG